MTQKRMIPSRLLRSNEKRLVTLNAISSMLSCSLELEQVLRGALDMVMEVMEVEAALIFSLDEEAQELRLVACDGVSDRFALDVERMKVGGGFNGLVAQTGEPLLIEDASYDPRLTRQVVRQEKIQAQLIIPLTGPRVSLRVPSAWRIVAHGTSFPRR